MWLDASEKKSQRRGGMKTSRLYEPKIYYEKSILMKCSTGGCKLQGFKVFHVLQPFLSFFLDCLVHLICQKNIK